MKRNKNTVELLQEFSIPLVMGVLASLLWANLDYNSYGEFLRYPLTPFENSIDFAFLVNNVFMVFFFGIATVEITQSVLPGGDLYPPKRAIGPLFATFGGIVVPVLFYLGLCFAYGDLHLIRGWGIPTATDIALAWLIARFIFGKNHPAVAFLLLLAIADDAIGLAIIAIVYPTPDHPPAPLWLLLVLFSMILAWSLRKQKVKNFWVYLFTAGLCSWFGLFKAGIHPALALITVVPFMPYKTRQPGHLFEEKIDSHSALENFEHQFKVFVDFGLFSFGLANAGVLLTGVDDVTWYILLSLLLGKTIGIFGFGLLGIKLGYPLPKGMNGKDLVVVGAIASVGLTVALFMAGVAFENPTLQGSAKMGALLSVSGVLLAVFLAKIFKIRSSST